MKEPHQMEGKQEDGGRKMKEDQGRSRKDYEGRKMREGK